MPIGWKYVKIKRIFKNMRTGPYTACEFWIPPYVEGVPTLRALIELAWDNANNHTEEAVIMELKD